MVDDIDEIDIEIEIDKYIGRGECIDIDTVIVRNWPT